MLLIPPIAPHPQPRLSWPTHNTYTESKAQPVASQALKYADFPNRNWQFLHAILGFCRFLLFAICLPFCSDSSPMIFWALVAIVIFICVRIYCYRPIALSGFRAVSNEDLTEMKAMKAAKMKAMKAAKIPFLTFESAAVFWPKHPLPPDL